MHLYKVSIRYEITEDDEACHLYAECESEELLRSMFQDMLDGNTCGGGKQSNAFWSISSIAEVSYGNEQQELFEPLQSKEDNA